MTSSNIQNVFNNIVWAREAVHRNLNPRIVSVVCGSAMDQQYWQQRLRSITKKLFNINGKTHVVALEERLEEKTRQGNFLGTLLAYRRIKEKLVTEKGSLSDEIILIGMLFGRGERMSPFTQILGNRKPAIRATSPKIYGDKEDVGLAVIEEAMHYIAPLTGFLKNGGFAGVLCKWGDETQIPSIDYSKRAKVEDLSEFDVIKFVSVMKITEDLAKEKDWVVFDDDKNMLTQVSRNEKKELIKQLELFNIQERDDGEFYAGISLGTVAVSHNVLEIANDVFGEDIKKDGVYFDFDPYFFMALTMDNQPEQWERLVSKDEGLKQLVKMLPDFFDKVQKIKEEFQNRNRRTLNIRVFDLGEDLLWSDMGQHVAMREKYMLLNDKGVSGQIACQMENISFERDKKGNIIVGSYIDSKVKIQDSVIVNSVIAGPGNITGSVIKNSILGEVEIENSFVVDSFRTKVILGESCGLYESIGKEELVLKPGLRHGTLLTDDDVFDLEIDEKTNLRDKDNTYNKPVLKNKISFQKAYELMENTSLEAIERRKKKLIKPIIEKIVKKISKKSTKEVKQIVDTII